MRALAALYAPDGRLYDPAAGQPVMGRAAEPPTLTAPVPEVSFVASATTMPAVRATSRRPSSQGWRDPFVGPRRSHILPRHLTFRSHSAPH